MKKTMNKVALMSAILCVVYMALAMLIPFAHNIVFGIAVCTTLILFVLAAVGCKAAIAKGEGWQSRLLGWPIFKVAAMMLIAQIALSFVLMAVSVASLPCCLWNSRSFLISTSDTPSP